MIAETSSDGTGFAIFSDDRSHRYILRRLISNRAGLASTGAADPARWNQEWNRIVFLMINPSTADAFKPDRTVDRCVKFGQRWGGDVLEVVNLFSFVSPYPADLRWNVSCHGGQVNDTAIREACIGAKRVIAAWGTDGALYSRDNVVKSMLAQYGVPLEVLGLTKEGFPKHPLARGKHRIPDDKEPQPWA